MQTQNRFSFSFKGSPELSEAFAGKKVGDKCKLVMLVQVDSFDENGMSGTILETGPMDYTEGKEEKEEEPEVTPPAPEVMSEEVSKSPAMMAVGGMNEGQ